MTCFNILRERCDFESKQHNFCVYKRIRLYYMMDPTHVCTHTYNKIKTHTLLQLSLCNCQSFNKVIVPELICEETRSGPCKLILISKRFLCFMDPLKPSSSCFSSILNINQNLFQERIENTLSTLYKGLNQCDTPLTKANEPMLLEAVPPYVKPWSNCPSLIGH